MDIVAIERVDTVTIKLTREQVYQTQRFLHHNLQPVAKDAGTELSKLRNTWAILYNEVENRFGDG